MIKQIGQHNIKRDIPTCVNFRWMDNCSLVLQKVHPKILSSRCIIFVAKFLPNLFMAFGKIIHNADRLLKSVATRPVATRPVATRPHKTKPSRMGRGRLPQPLLDRDSQGCLPSSRTVASVASSPVTSMAAGDGDSRHAPESRALRHKQRVETSFLVEVEV
jgi:hypothetical protein